MPAQKCTICSHSRRGAAEALLNQGLSPRKAAKQLNISYPSLERHRTTCMVKAMRGKVDAAAIIAPATIRDPRAELDRLQSETRELFEHARKNLDYEVAFKAVAQLRLNIQLAARMAGVLEPNEDLDSHTLTLDNMLKIVEKHRSGGRPQ